MQRVGMFYATKEGHARQVAERVGAALKARTLDVAVHDVKDADADAALVRSDAAVLVGSVHLGKHEPELIAFVKGCDPEVVYTHHGSADTLAEEIKKRLGIEARSLLPPPKQRRLGDFE